MDEGITQPVVIKSALEHVTDGLTCSVQSRTLLHDAGEWIAGVVHNVPDAPMQREIAHAAQLVHDAEQAVQDIAAKLRRRMEVLREGQSRITQAPGGMRDE